MQTLYHEECCDGEKHWVCCDRPKTWDACNDWRPCTKMCIVYIKNQNISFRDMSTSTTDLNKLYVCENVQELSHDLKNE